ncbi:MAG: GTP cyclohydrolase I FolE, partial [Bacteroidetes bacterium]
MGSYKQFEEYNTEVTKKLKGNFLEILEGVGEDIHREGILRTPERAAKVMQYLTSGHCEDPAEILRSAMFAEDYHDMVIVKDIEIYSLCEHHILPFYGKAHVAYIPDGQMVGLSKIPRVVDVFS